MISVYSMTPNLKGFVDRIHDLSYLGLFSVCSVSVHCCEYRSQQVLLYPGLDWVSFSDIDLRIICTAAKAYGLDLSVLSIDDLPIIRVIDYRL